MSIFLNFGLPTSFVGNMVTLSILLVSLLFTLVHGQNVRPASNQDNRIEFWYQCKQECLQLTWACEMPCRNYAESRLEYKMCAVECKLDRLVCYDQCREFIASGLWQNISSNTRNRRRLFGGQENEFGETFSRRNSLLAFLNNILES